MYQDQVPRDRPPYQLLLRSLGAVLDADPPRRFSLIEVEDGFEIVLEQEGGRLQRDHVTRDKLKRILEDPNEAPKRPSRRDHSTWSTGASTRQDSLRALGYELDDVEATNIMLDDLGDSVLLTYSFVDPAQGYIWQKRMLVLKPEQMAEIVETARGRRQRRKRLLGVIPR
jgi:hypothetical protein